jgi:hypothetical protein
LQVNELIKKMIDRELEGLYVALPAKIQKYDPGKMRADVVLMAKEKLGDEEVINPPIVEVPVSHLKAGPFLIRPPYKKGDVVQVLFNEKAIDNLLVDNKPRPTELKRKHSLDDAVIISGFKTEREDDYPSEYQEDLLICNSETGEMAVLKKGGGAVLDINDLVIESSDIKLGSTNASESLATKSELNDLKELTLNHAHPFTDVTPSGPVSSVTQATTSEKVDYSGTSKVVAE